MNAAGRAERAALVRAGLKLVPIDFELRPRQGENLDHDSELEEAESVVKQTSHAAKVAGAHGRILAYIGISAYRQCFRIEQNWRMSLHNDSVADPQTALEHFEKLLSFETDCWDVHEALASDAPRFVLLDVRGPQAFEAGHVPGSVHLPHGRINERNLAAYPPDTLFVVYCNGPHCNGADRAAVRLARLGRKVKKMIGGAEGWKDEGFQLEKAAEAP
jgi:rhodanese-related sulfurtransferase